MWDWGKNKVLKQNKVSTFESIKVRILIVLFFFLLLNSMMSSKGKKKNWATNQYIFEIWERNIFQCISSNFLIVRNDFLIQKKTKQKRREVKLSYEACFRISSPFILFLIGEKKRIRKRKKTWRFDLPLSSFLPIAFLTFYSSFFFFYNSSYS